MDPLAMQYLAKYLVPLVAILSVFGMPVALLWILKHFKLRHRELDLEAQLHGRELEMRLRAMEARQAAIETALTAIGSSRPVEQKPSPVEQRVSLLEPPGASAESTETTKTADPLRIRSR
jgi:hypothetical protein